MARMKSPWAWSKPAARAEVWPKLRRSLMTRTRRVDGGDLFEQTVGAVAGAIVDEDQFEGVADLLHDGLQAVVERGDVLLLVVEGNDDGIFRHELMIPPGTAGLPEPCLGGFPGRLTIH